MSAANEERARELHRDGKPRGPCAVCNHGDRDDALSVDLAPDNPPRLLFNCFRNATHSGVALLNGHERAPAARRRQPDPPPDFAARWKAARPAPEDHRYLQDKGIKPNGAKVERGNLLLPMGKEGAIVGLQTITPDGSKKYAKGSKPRGACLTLGAVDAARPVCVAEGFATGATVFEATTFPVFVAFDAGNLMAVARRVRKSFENADIVIAGDNDTGTEGNPGRTKATAAALAVRGRLAIPNFGDVPGTDWNDLARAVGPDAVREQIAAARAPEPVPRNDGAPLVEWSAEQAEALAMDRMEAGGAPGSGVEARSGGSRMPALLEGRTGPRACEENARRILTASEGYSTLHYDDFLGRMRIFGRDWTDDDARMALCLLQAINPFGVAFTIGQIHNASATVAFGVRRNMLQGFIAALPQWDGTERIEMAFIDAWGAPDTTLTRAAAKNFFIAMIARAMKPGSKVDTLWAFEGLQGTGKSKALAALAGEIEGEPMHAEIQAPIGSTDFYRELRSVWIAELAEMDSLRGREASTIKRVLSALYDRFVEKYEKHARRYLRTAVAVASTNEATYWQDPTGTRRLVPVTCTEISIDLIEANRLQWLAEAKALFEAGTTWWEFPGDEFREAGQGRQATDPWQEAVEHFLIGKDAATVAEVLDSIGLPVADRTPVHEKRAAACLRMAEWLPPKNRERLNGQLRRVWRKPPLSR